MFRSEQAIIRDEMLDFGDRIWGFAIYRCTYDDDAAWRRFMDIANARVRQDLSTSDVPELIDSLHWKVFDDRARFDGASKDEVRQHFLSWCASDEAKAEKYGEGAPPPELKTMHCHAPRYSFCVHVDAASLHSVVCEGPQPPDPDYRGIGWVNLIDSEWEMPDPATFDYEDNGMDPATDDPTDEGEEPYEGCRLYNVGWMRMGMQQMGVPAYSTFGQTSMYDLVYRRPPGVWAEWN